MRIFKQETNLKMVISGLIVEKYRYLDNSVGYGNFEDVYEQGKAYKNNSFQSSFRSSEDIQKYNEIIRKRRFRRLVDSNVNVYSKQQNLFYPPILQTLTYNQQQEDIQKSKEDLNLFIKRLNYNLDNSGLKYLAVPELTKIGRIHFHTLFFNLPFVSGRDLARCWGKGFIDVRRIDRVRSMGRYMTKYLLKGSGGLLYKKKSYLSSKDLKKPITIFNQELAEGLEKRLSDSRIISKKLYRSFWQGQTEYTCYNLPELLPIDLIFKSDNIKV